MLDLVPGQVAMRDIAYGQGPLPVPGNIIDVVKATLAARASSALSLLEAAAVLGRTFRDAQASALAGLADDDLSLEEAITASLIRELTPVGSGRFSFTHMLVHQAVYEHMKPARRRELHRKAAAMLGGTEALRHRAAADDRPDSELADDLVRQANLETVRGHLATAAGYRDEALLRTPPGPQPSAQNGLWSRLPIIQKRTIGAPRKKTGRF